MTGRDSSNSSLMLDLSGGKGGGKAFVQVYLDWLELGYIEHFYIDVHNDSSSFNTFISLPL